MGARSRTERGTTCQATSTSLRLFPAITHRARCVAHIRRSRTDGAAPGVPHCAEGARGHNTVMALADALHALLRLSGATYSCVVERDSGRVLAEWGNGGAGPGASEGASPHA